MRGPLFVVLAAIFVLPAAAQEKIGLPASLIEDVFRKADCTNDAGEAVKKKHEVAGDLGGGLKLVDVSCSGGAYNFSSVLFAVDPAKPQEARSLPFRHWEDEHKGFRPTLALTFPSYDEKTGRLRTHHKFRGPGDCGHAGLWRWNGMAFEMERYCVKNKCDGDLFDPEENPAKFGVFPPRTRKK
ncbi:MAG TPA: DUF1176 domain-containing protein [Xanthobacteraceae bacterium]|nr:DUF1176 domain-containing protein [Xanthobacteraceae bacterium]